MPEIRLFIGIPPDTATAAAISSFVTTPRNLPPGFRWTAPEQWHVTALFIGNLPQHRLPEITEAIGIIAAKQARFTLLFDHYTYRFRQKQPTMLWAQYRIHPVCTQLYHCLHGDLSPLVDLEPLRDEPLPHITLARIRKLRKVPFVLPEHASLPPLPVQAITLYRSTLQSDGARYTALHTFALPES